MPRVVRKQNPPALTDYRKYKPYLRLDFDRRCAYCHIPELRYGTPGNYHIDHFRPKSRPEFLTLVCHYGNLYYACRDCNIRKGPTWPDDVLTSMGFRFLDPCLDDFTRHWSVADDGRLVPKSLAGEYTIARLDLNRRRLCEWRRDKVEHAARIRAVAEMIESAKPQSRDLAKTLFLLKKQLKVECAAEYGRYW